MAALQYSNENQGWLLDKCSYNDASSLVLGTIGSDVNNSYPGAAWLDDLYLRMGRNIGVLECPEQKTPRPTGALAIFYQLMQDRAPLPAGPVPQSWTIDPRFLNGPASSNRREFYPGYMATNQLHSWDYSKNTYFAGSRSQGRKLRQFKDPTQKIWYMDGGVTVPNSASTLAQAQENFRPFTSFGLQAAVASGANGGQLSGRHGTRSNMRGNVLFFDGHAANVACAEVTVIPEVRNYWLLTPAQLAQWGRYWDPDGDGYYFTPP
jgi:prepilin-type processing-associated H-X9-DG protein